MAKNHRLDIENQEMKFASELGDVASQVAHDIRSPLAALKIVTKNSKNLPVQERDILRAAVGRIQDIAEVLLNKYQNTKLTEGRGDLNTYMVSSLVDSISAEKRFQLRAERPNIVLKTCDRFPSYGVFARVNAIELQRVLSNLVNNAIEAVPGFGAIKIRIKRRGRFLELTVVDNGVGIDPGRTKEIFNKGVSCNKESGSGLGLHHAAATIEGWGGSISVRSKLGWGTAVRIELPLVAPPVWFVAAIALTDVKALVIVDDDAPVHQLWRMRLRNGLSRKSMPQIHTYLSLEDFERDCVAERFPKNTIYLVDHEFTGSSQVGMQVIERMQIQNRSILVTSKYEDREVLSDAERMGVRLLPKNQIGVVPVIQGAGFKQRSFYFGLESYQNSLSPLR